MAAPNSQRWGGGWRGALPGPGEGQEVEGQRGDHRGPVWGGAALGLLALRGPLWGERWLGGKGEMEQRQAGTSRVQPLVNASTNLMGGLPSLC